LSFLISFK